MDAVLYVFRFFPVPGITSFLLCLRWNIRTFEHYCVIQDC